MRFSLITEQKESPLSTKKLRNRNKGDFSGALPPSSKQDPLLRPLKKSHQVTITPKILWRRFKKTGPFSTSIKRSRSQFYTQICAKHKGATLMWMAFWRCSCVSPTFVLKYHRITHYMNFVSVVRFWFKCSTVNCFLSKKIEKKFAV